MDYNFIKSIRMVLKSLKNIFFGNFMCQFPFVAKSETEIKQF